MPNCRNSETHNIILPNYFSLVNILGSLLSPAHGKGGARATIKNINPIYKLTGIPVLLNTSFNEAGEPIIETSDDAIKSFLKMNMDVLYLNITSC